MPIDDWPDDADGDVLRRMRSRGFDFSKEHVIDFNVDFDDWPPAFEAMRALQGAFPGASVYEDADSEDRFVLFKIKSVLTYELVVNTQARATGLVQKYGGRCESWGVLHD
jgi:hypothetical protein